MKNRLVSLYWKLRSNYWFIPTTLALLSLVAAVGLTYLDHLNHDSNYFDLSWLEFSSATAARSILVTVASSMITVTGIVFSITIVTLSLASQQFGPRLLQNFMHDRGSQVVLGTVISTFLYCLLVMRTVDDRPGEIFVPHLSVLMALVLAVLCVGALIYFIHHIAESIQLNNVIAAVSRELSDCIESQFPERTIETIERSDVDDALAQLLPSDFDRQARPVPAAFHGYLQTLDDQRLLRLACEEDLVLRIGHRVGHFIVTGVPLVDVYPGDAARKEDLIERINDCFLTSVKRSEEKDPLFLLDELVEIATRALSPGTNDPFTAIACINHLGIALCNLAQRVFPPLLLRDDQDRVRIVSYPITFEKVVDAAFNQIRQYGRGHAAVTIRLLEILRVVLPFTRHPRQRDALLHQATMIERGSHEGLPEESDRLDVHNRYLAIFTTLEETFGLGAEH